MRQALSLFLVLILAQVGLGSSIGINFIGGRDNDNSNGAALLAADLAGVVGGTNPDLRQANWNNVLPADQVNGNAPALVNDSGATTTAQITISGVASLWNLPSLPGSDPNHKLMYGYLDTTNTSQSRLDITGIPYSKYDVVVYFDGSNSSSLARVGRYEIAGQPAVFGRDRLNFASIFTSVPLSSNADLGANTPAGNYIHFHGLNTSSFTLLASAGTGDSSGTARAPLNAVQIIQVPEPTAVITMAAGLLATLLLTRWLPQRSKSARTLAL
jgi:hypothetical protein